MLVVKILKIQLSISLILVTTVNPVLSPPLNTGVEECIRRHDGIKTVSECAVTENTLACHHYSNTGNTLSCYYDICREFKGGNEAECGYRCSELVDVVEECKKITTTTTTTTALATTTMLPSSVSYSMGKTIGVLTDAMLDASKTVAVYKYWAIVVTILLFVAVIVIVILRYQCYKRTSAAHSPTQASGMPLLNSNERTEETSRVDPPDANGRRSLESEEVEGGDKEKNKAHKDANTFRHPADTDPVNDEEMAFDDSGSI